ncbi:MAG: hypothetical protein QOH81_1621 [Sphingomonadales bacterium]|nr:hypothetical protein [Sphingomonadales bacterium]
MHGQAKGGTAIFQPLPIAILVGIGLTLLLLLAVRQGRFASPAARMAALAVIILTAVLIWLGPISFLAR